MTVSASPDPDKYWDVERDQEEPLYDDWDRDKEKEIIEHVEREINYRTTAFDRTKHKDYTRGFVRWVCEELHRQYLASKNPLYLLEAVMMCSSTVVSPMLLPDWCHPYLYEAMGRLVRLRGDGESLNRAIANSLGLTRRGWVAYKAKFSEDRAERAAKLYEGLVLQGVKSPDAYEQVREVFHRGDVQAATQLVRDGRALIKRRREMPRIESQGQS
jgi:hypothetical protein